MDVRAAIAIERRRIAKASVMAMTGRPVTLAELGGPGATHARGPASLITSRMPRKLSEGSPKLPA
jgi:hypothetical protein